MLTIHLKQLRFFCHHGFYEEEKIVGGEFMIDLELEVEEHAAVIYSLHESINYVKVYHIVKRRMMHPTALLETIVMEMADEVLSASILAKKVSIHLTKLAPPMINFEGHVGVSYSKSRG